MFVRLAALLAVYPRLTERCLSYISPQIFIISNSIVLKQLHVLEKASESAQTQNFAQKMDYDAMDGLEDVGPRVTVRQVIFCSFPPKRAISNYSGSQRSRRLHFRKY